jgi:hypothetical protein
MEEQDSLIKRAVAKAKNKDVSEVSFVDITKKKARGKKKSSNFSAIEQKDIFAQDESIHLTGSTGTNYVTFDGISKGRKVFKKPSNLLEWKDRDFFIYAHSLYQKKFKDGWTLNSGGAIIEIQKIRDDLSSLFGKQSNIILKDYITFCFKNYVDKLMRGNKRGKFYFKQLRFKYVLEAFYNNYGERLGDQREKEVVQGVFKNILTTDALEQSYLLSEEGFVCDFGIVVAFNWLVINKKINRQLAAKKIYDVCHRIYKGDFFKIIKKATEKWSPYPDWFIMKEGKLDLFVKKIDPTLIVNVKFEKSIKISKRFNFIRREK